MTDKENIRAYIEKLHQEHRGSKGDSIFRNALRTVLFYIDSMQEEHKETKKECMYSKEFFTNKDRKVLCDGCEEDCKYNKKEPIAPKVLEDMLNAKTATESLGISQEEHDAIIDKCLYGKEPELVDVDDLPKEEPVSVWHNMDEVPIKGEVIVVQTKDTFYGVSVQKGGTTYKNKNKDRYVKWAYASDLLNLSNVQRTVKNWKEEPVSEDLEEAARNIRDRLYLEEGKRDEFGNPYFLQNTILKAVIMGAQWQKEQFEKNRLKHCNSITNEQAELEQGFIDQHLDKHQRMPTYLDAIEYGMKLQKEQMMASGTDVTVHIEAGNYPYLPQIELYDYDKDMPLAKEGEKYKVVLIKED